MDFQQIFGSDGPVELEIGSGKGEFLTEVSRRRPDTNFIGVEISRKYSLRTAVSIARAGVSNARIICKDSRKLLKRSIPTASLQAIHIYFPDPWPKRRHHKRRVFTPGFSVAAARTLKPGGSLFFLTDHEGLYFYALQMLGESGGLAPNAFDISHPGRPRTGYESRWLLENRPILGARWMRRGR